MKYICIGAFLILAYWFAFSLIMVAARADETLFIEEPPGEREE